MKAIFCYPEINHFKKFKEFVAEFHPGQGDLVLTSKSALKDFLPLLGNQADILYYSDYFQGEPSDEGFAKLAEAVATKGPHKRVFGIGGGSIMDVAKLFALEQQLPVYDLFQQKIQAKKDKELILVPTTCGTGSEVTNISIMAFVEAKSKNGLAIRELYADSAVLIPELLQALPYKYFVTSSIDALVHAMESILSPKANEYTKLFGYRALDMILTAYTRIATRGEKARYDLLEEFLIASNFAGLSFGTAGCGTVHAMSYPLSGTFHVPHGEANYAVLRGVMNKYVSGGLEGELLILCRHIGAVLYAEPAEAINDLMELLEQILPCKKLSEYGADEAMVTQWAPVLIATQQRLLGNSYRPMTEAELIEIYKEML